MNTKINQRKCTYHKMWYKLNCQFGNWCVFTVKYRLNLNWNLLLLLLIVCAFFLSLRKQFNSVPKRLKFNKWTNHENKWFAWNNRVLVNCVSNVLLLLLFVFPLFEFTCLWNDSVNARKQNTTNNAEQKKKKLILNTRYKLEQKSENK